MESKCELNYVYFYYDTKKKETAKLITKYTGILPEKNIILKSK
jgi:hypothetical protein